MNHAYDVLVLGELLIDFTPAGYSPDGSQLFEANPGGAPANVLACLAKLERKAAFIGKVGDDEFGRLLRKVLEEKRIDSQGLVLDPEFRTTLAFVHLREDGERSFSFYRDPGADTQLSSAELAECLFDATVLHFGSLSLTREPARSATLAAVQLARGKGMLVSYDPNLRPLLWPSLEEARQQILAVMGQADIVKISGEELSFLTGSGDLKEASEELVRRFGLRLLLVTLGQEGCFYRRGLHCGHVPGFQVRAVDTIGAGDGFLDGFLHQVLEREKPLEEWTSHELQSSIRFANAVGALAVTRRGGVPAMPALAEVRSLLGPEERGPDELPACPCPEGGPRSPFV